MTEPILHVSGLHKRYGALRVTEDVHLAVAPATIHAIIGPNGAGKTSLIHQISGIVTPDAGTVHLAGRDITRLPLHARARAGLARGFQISSVLPEFTVLENVALAVQANAGHSFRFVRAAANQESLNAPARDAIDRVGLTTRLETPARRLSHGEKRQLELAIAIAARPRVLLLDEPLAGAGPDETARVIALLATLRLDCAILLVEHDMDAVFTLADRLTVMVNGQVIASGTPAEIRANAGVQAAYLGEEH